MLRSEDSDEETKLIEPLGTSLDFDEPESLSSLPEDDLARILLLKADLPDMTAGDVGFKIGSASMKELILSLTRARADDSQPFGLQPVPPDEPTGCALFQIPDSHRYSIHPSSFFTI